MTGSIKSKIRSSGMRRVIIPLYGKWRKTMNTLKGMTIYRENLKKYRKANENASFAVVNKYKFPQYGDRFESAGNLSPYFWQDLWAARLIAKNNPGRHYDIGSRIDGFIAHLASFRDNIVLIDIRPMVNVISGVDFFQANATDLIGIEDESIESLSALCSLEHFGLGRYGDPIDPEACFKAFRAIVRVMKNGGHAYIAVPIGKEHLEFDAHRVFYARTVINAFKPMKCVEFSCIHPRDAEIERDIEIDKYDNDEELGGARFGLFHFVK